MSRNVVIHYLSHDADLVPEDQPSYQVQQVIDGKLDVAAVWGPFAGYYKAMKHAPLTLQPVNLMEDCGAAGIRHGARGAPQRPAICSGASSRRCASSATRFTRS